MKYILLYNIHIKGLTESVNKYLSEGWELYGFPMYEAGGYCMQAMIYKERDPSIDRGYGG